MCILFCLISFWIRTTSCQRLRLSLSQSLLILNTQCEWAWWECSNVVFMLLLKVPRVSMARNLEWLTFLPIDKKALFWLLLRIDSTLPCRDRWDNPLLALNRSEDLPEVYLTPLRDPLFSLCYFALLRRRLGESPFTVYTYLLNSLCSDSLQLFTDAGMLLKTMVALGWRNGPSCFLCLLSADAINLF